MKFPIRKALIAGAVGTAAAGTLATVGVTVAAAAAIRRFRMAEMAGKVVLITGGSRGLGFAMAQEFAALGARVVICARNADELHRAEEELRSGGGDVLSIVCDVGKEEEVRNLVEETTRRFGPVDVLVNNAGIISVGPIETQTIDDFREAMDVMFWGLVYPTLAVLPEMKRRRRGWIANITSIGGKISVPHLVPYSCAKFAGVGLSEGLTAELAKDGIHVTTVVPGLMRTGSHLNAYFKGDHRAEFSWFSVGAANPAFSISARRAARTIVRAIRRGQAEIVLSLPAKLAVLFHGVAPGTTTRILGVQNRFMPGTGATEKERYLGRDSETAISRSVLTSPGRKAAHEFLQHPHQDAV